MLVRNEDIFVEQALLSIVEFCDSIIVLDNCSTDGTYSILERLAAKYAHIEIRRIVDAHDSHKVLEPLAGDACWVLGIDGDEIYDRKGLGVLREQLRAGAFDDWWVIFGNVLNCVELDYKSGVARGYLAPPCRSMTKLYNFGMIKSWTNCPQRLHGGELVFGRGHRFLRNNLFLRTPWEESQFRCLHTCFMRRSSRDPITGKVGLTRLNVTEEQQSGVKRQLLRGFFWLIGRSMDSHWKLEKYRRGPLVEKEVSAFLFPLGSSVSPMNSDRSGYAAHDQGP